MTTYRVTAEHTRSGWWALEASEVGAVSQTRRLDRAEAEMREAIAFLADVPESEVEVEVIPVIPDEVREAMRNSEALRSEAQKANREAAAEARRAARTLHAAKYTYRDIGTVLGVSHQRAEQLVKS